MNASSQLLLINYKRVVAKLETISQNAPDIVPPEKSTTPRTAVAPTSATAGVVVKSSLTSSTLALVAEHYRNLEQFVRPVASIGDERQGTVVDEGTELDVMALLQLSVQIIEITADDESLWEAACFIVTLLHCLLTASHNKCHYTRDINAVLCTDATSQLVEQVIYRTLEHPEARVRFQAVEIVEHEYAAYNLSLATSLDQQKQRLKTISEYFLARIADNWNRKLSTREAVLGDVSLISLDDTTGWRYLESYVGAYHALVLGAHRAWQVDDAVTLLLMNVYQQQLLTLQCNLTKGLQANTLEVSDTATATDDSMSKDATEHIDDGDTSRYISEEGCIHDVNAATFIILMTGCHINRHLRERTMKFVGDLLGISCNSTISGEQERNISLQSCERLVEIMVTVVSIGLEDDWSQIRYAATLACQQLIRLLLQSSHETCSNFDNTDKYLKRLIPQLCMNRHYTADSVRTASQSTWREVLGAQGRQLLIKYISLVVEYYIKMTTARNHMVCEAACQAIAEVSDARKINEITMRDHVSSLFTALWLCLEDDRWPVRDAACFATAVLTRFYPQQVVNVLQSKESKVVTNDFVDIGDLFKKHLFMLWTRNLQDSIWSVREHAAQAFAEAAQCVEVKEISAAAVQTAMEYAYMVLSEAAASLDTNEEGNILIGNTAQQQQQQPQQALPMATRKGKSFLPQSLLLDAAAKKQNKAMRNDDKKPVLTSSQNVKKTYRRGWGCCVDCVELRESVQWERVQGAMYILREFTSITPSLLHWCNMNTSNRDGNGLWMFVCHLLRCNELENSLIDIFNEDESNLRIALYNEIPRIIHAMLQNKSTMTEAHAVLIKLEIWKIAGALQRDVTEQTIIKKDDTNLNNTVESGKTATRARAAQRKKSKLRLAAEKCLIELEDVLIQNHVLSTSSMITTTTSRNEMMVLNELMKMRPIPS